MQIPLSSDLRSPHSMYSPAPRLRSSFSRYQPTASSDYPIRHSLSREAVPVPTVAEANTRYQQSVATSHASSDRTVHTIPSSRSTTQLSYTHVSTAPSPVSYIVPPETSESTTKKKITRFDDHQTEALMKVFVRNRYPSTKERQQLAMDLDMSARSVQIWLAHAFVYIACLISELLTIPPGSRTEDRV